MISWNGMLFLHLSTVCLYIKNNGNCALVLFSFGTSYLRQSWLFLPPSLFTFLTPPLPFSLLSFLLPSSSSSSLSSLFSFLLFLFLFLPPSLSPFCLLSPFLSFFLNLLPASTPFHTLLVGTSLKAFLARHMEEMAPASQLEWTNNTDCTSFMESTLL